MLVIDGEAPAPVLLSPEQLAQYKETESAFFLGEGEGRAYFAVELDENEFGAFERAGRFGICERSLPCFPATMGPFWPMRRPLRTGTGEIVFAASAAAQTK